MLQVLHTMVSGSILELNQLMLLQIHKSAQRALHLGNLQTTLLILMDYMVSEFIIDISQGQSHANHSVLIQQNQIHISQIHSLLPTLKISLPGKMLKMV